MFVSKPFSKWTKKFDACRKHASSQYHLDAMVRMCEFKDAVNNPKTAIENVLDSERMRLIERNRHVIASLFKVVVLCGKQGIALRGHRDDNINWDNTTVASVSADILYHKTSYHVQMLKISLNWCVSERKPITYWQNI